jgi:response regulator RpfG family c-di-GMP phosphodiesterase
VFPARFTRRHMEAMETFGCQVSVAYRNALAVGATRDLYLSTLKTLAIAIKKRDPSATDCTDRVLDMVVALGRAMRLGEDEMMTLEIAALFHDLGMVAAGSSLARDDRPLTTLEHGLLKMHPVIAAEVISEAPALREVAPILYHHHERFDGLGYVGGLAGEDIPVGARVLSVVDAYVAMTSPRAYRSALTRMQAVDELRKNAGSQFDPEVVERFVEILFTEGARAHDAAGS